MTGNEPSVNRSTLARATAPTRARTARPATQKDSLNAGAGGIGFGTLTVWTAQQVGTNTAWGQLLMYAAPFLSVVLGAVVLFLLSGMNMFALVRTAKKSRKALAQLRDSPNVSAEVKAEIQSNIDEIDRRLSSAHLARVQWVSTFGQRWQSKVDEPG